MIRIAATGDLHFGVESRGSLRPSLEGIEERADLLLLTGDLTRIGMPEEAAVCADELAGLGIPVVTVLGNHDYHAEQQREVTAILERRGIRVLEGDTLFVDAGGARIGIAGVKGFGGGFPNACATDFGEPEMKAFIRHSRVVAGNLQAALENLDGDLRIAMTHYAPIDATLQGERMEIFPFLGSYLLGEAIDRARADLVLHGHAHHGTERGMTPDGIPVRNVAWPVIRRPYKVYCLNGADSLACEPAGERAAAD